MRSAHTRTLGFGQFFGRPLDRFEVSGFALSRITAAGPPDAIPEHVHETAHVVLVLEGAYLTTAARPEPGRPPALIYNPPGTAHSDRFHGEHGTFFTLSLSQRRLDTLGLPGTLPERPLGLASGRAVRRARRLVRLCEDWPRHAAARAEAYCIDLLVELSDEARGRGPRPPRWLASTRELLSRHYEEPASVRDLAARAGVHPVHLIRSFTRFYGMTPGEFLRERRVRAAAGLLETTRLPIVEIALRTGFADQSHLTRVFARALGVPPATYRRRMRNDRPARISR